MHKLAIAGALALVIGSSGLAGCAAYNDLEAASGFSVTQGQLDAARSAYDGVFLAPAAAYRQLGYCATGTSATLQKPCADRSIVAKLRAADAAVNNQFLVTQSMISAGDNTGAVAAFSTLESLISTAESIATAAGVK